eukprot:scaffold91465_cov37-Cyclotella_meneghiniana.AAC.6
MNPQKQQSTEAARKHHTYGRREATTSIMKRTCVKRRRRWGDGSKNHCSKAVKGSTAHVTISPKQPAAWVGE